MPPSYAWILSPRPDSLMVFRIRRVKKTWILEQSSSIPISLSDLISGRDTGSEDLSRLGMSRPNTAEVVLLWPGELSGAGSFSLPGIPENDLKKVVSGEIESVIPWDVDTCQIAFHAERKGTGWETYVWATPRKLVERAVSKLTRTGLEPKHVIPESFTLFAGTGTRTAGISETEAVVGPMPGRLLVQVLKGGFPQRETVLTCPPGTDFGDTLDQLLAAYYLLELPETCELRWIGPEASDASSDPDPADGWHTADEERIRLAASGIWKGWSVRRGLPDVRSGSMAFRKDQEHLVRKFRTLAAMGLVLLLLGGIDAWIHVHGLRTRVEKTRSFLDGLAKQSLSPAPVIEPISQLRQKRNALLDQKRFLSRGTDMIAILKDIATEPPGNIPFEMVSVSLGSRRLSLSGKTDSFQHVEAVRQALLKSPHIRSLSVQSARLDIDHKTVAFRMGGVHD